jgi:DNA-binding MarR family transcriptional regulator
MLDESATDDVGGQLRRAVTRLYSRFRSERMEGEVPEAALLVLIVLGKRGPLSLTDLAGAAHVSLGSMSQTVRRLEQLGYVTKSRGTRDHRTVDFALSDSGRVVETASREHRRSWLDARIAELTPTEREDVARAAALLLRIADS